MKIALASDHAGFEQLKELKKYLDELGHECIDFGPKSLNQEDDYPDFIFPAARSVSEGSCQAGIILGGSGQGEAMAANRLKGVRCSVFYGPAVAKKAIDLEGTASYDPYEIIRLSKMHNNANILSLAARFVNLEEMKTVVKLWLETPYTSESRHERRNKKLDREQ